MKKLLLIGLILTSIGAAHATVPDESTLKKTVTSQKYVDDVAATKQTKLTAQEGDYAVIYPNSENEEDDGAVSPRPIIDYIVDANYEGELVTARAVKRVLDSKQAQIDGSNALNGKVITYTGSVGAVGTRDVYNDGTAYAGQSGALISAGNVNTAITNGFNALLTCAEYSDGYTAQTDPTGDYCILYQVNTLSGTYIPQTVSQNP